ncbi:hypothetical protein GCM10007047_12030 [Cerasicoccus arenae]|uniref:Uncharacterized protein n=2 Tax=Cerasicoccus arenae TaxID=424488 RepID=A0A8J3DGX2_9BACT|nr:hypothetical protein GCM10007047_12030 [Cerasicoccus arenae]
MEVVMVLGMIALLAGIVTSLSLESLIGNNGSKPAYEVFREAAHEGRIQAINRAEIIYMTFNPETQTFLLSAKGAVSEEEIDGEPIVNRYGYFEDDPEEEAPVKDVARTDFPIFEDELEVEFRGVQAETDGPSAFSNEFTQDPLPHLIFHPSGVCSPAIVVMRYQNGDELTLTMDAFSNGPQLSRQERVSF